MRFGYNDGTVVDARDEGLLSYSVGYNNNLFIKPALPKSPFMTFTIDGVAYNIPYSDFIKRGNRTATLTFKTYQAALSRARAHVISGRILTSTSLVIPGQDIAGTALPYEFEWKFPRIKLTNRTGATEDAYNAVDVTTRVFPDAVTGSHVGLRVRALTSDNLQ